MPSDTVKVKSKEVYDIFANDKYPVPLTQSEIGTLLSGQDQEQDNVSFSGSYVPFNQNSTGLEIGVISSPQGDSEGSV